MNPITDNVDLKQTAPKSLNELAKIIHKVFESNQINVEEMIALMTSYKSNPIDWKQFETYDQYRYTRNLVDEGNGKFNLLIVCWEEGHASTIHDHANSHCFMKILEGSLSEFRFAWPENNIENQLKETSRVDLFENQVSYMNDELGLHRLENPKGRSVSLHLYTPPFSFCSVFDPKTGQRSKAQVTFWTKYGQKVQSATNSTTSNGNCPATQK